jgi:hypothetical protein
MFAAYYPISPAPVTSLEVFGTLAVLLGASVWIFWMLVKRSTSSRQLTALAEWARDEGWRMAGGPLDRPEPFDILSGPGLEPQLALSDRSGIESIVQLGNWNVLIRRIETPWKPTGLRQALSTSSVLELFSLSSFPLLGPSDRFVMFGTDPTAAAALSASSARALLPPDVGLLLHGQHLVLDFSSRPFDAVELNRMRALAAQIAGHLPPATR